MAAHCARTEPLAQCRAGVHTRHSEWIFAKPSRPAGANHPPYENEIRTHKQHSALVKTRSTIATPAGSNTRNGCHLRRCHEGSIKTGHKPIGFPSQPRAVTPQKLVPLRETCPLPRNTHFFDTNCVPFRELRMSSNKCRAGVHTRRA